MGSASKQSIAALARELRSRQGELATARELLAMIEALAGAPAVRQALADPEASATRKRSLIDRVFGAHASEGARALLAEAASRRWSDEAGFARGLEEYGIRAVAQLSGEGERIAAELLAIQGAIGEHGELELALSSKLSPAAGKRALAARLFAGRAGEPTLAVLDFVLAVPAGRRVRRLIAWAADAASSQAAREVAIVTSATPLADEQLARLEEGLARRYGRPIQVAALLDPAVIGGLRVEVGDDVIDDTVRTRLHGLRRALAG